MKTKLRLLSREDFRINSFKKLTSAYYTVQRRFKYTFLWCTWYVWRDEQNIGIDRYKYAYNPFDTEIVMTKIFYDKANAQNHIDNQLFVINLKRS